MSKGNQVLVRAVDEQVLIDEVCQTIVDVGQFPLAWSGRVEHDEDKTIRPIAAAGLTHYLDGAKFSWGDNAFGLGASGRAVKTQHVQLVDDIELASEQGPWRDRARRFGFRTGCVFPLLIGDEVIGTLSINTYDPGSLGPNEVALLSELADGLAFGIARLRDTKRLADSDTLLQGAEQRFRLTFEGNMAPMLFTDLEDEVTAANDAFCQLIGRTREEVLQYHATPFTHPDDLGITAEAHRRLLSGEVDQLRYVKRYFHKDGSTIFVDVWKFAARDPDGSMIYFVSSARDITEERSLSARLAKAQRLEAIGSLAGGIAHDFNNLLLVIQCYTPVLTQDPDAEALLDASQHIDEAVEAASSFTRQLLTYAREQDILPRATDLNEIVSATLGLMDQRLGDKIVVTTLLAIDLPSAWVDPIQIQQVLLNLIVNAGDAMPNGGNLDIRTALVELDQHQRTQPQIVVGGEYAMVEVSDSGVGMDEATLDRVFELFYTTKASGSGLGLATVYGITKQSRGYIEIDSELGVGTSFKLYFPLTDSTIP